MDKNEILAAGKQQKKNNFIVQVPSVVDSNKPHYYSDHSHQQKQRLSASRAKTTSIRGRSKREQEAADLALQQLAAAKLKRGRLLQQQGNRLPPPTQKFQRGDEEVDVFNSF